MATKSEIYKIIMVLNQMYPNQKYEISKDRREIVDMWHMLLGHYDYNTLNAAAIKVMSESPFIPKAADINNQIRSIIRLSVKTSTEAWGDVRKALSSYGWQRMAEAKETLDILTRSVVDIIGWQELCSSDNPEADRAHFMRMYEQMLNRQEETAMLPPQIRPMVAAVGAKLLSGGQYEAGKETNPGAKEIAGQARAPAGELAGCEE